MSPRSGQREIAPPPTINALVGLLASEVRKNCTAGLGVHVIMKIHFVEREGIKFETNRLHLSRQDELVMWAALIRFFIQLFFRELAWKF